MSALANLLKSIGPTANSANPANRQPEAEPIVPAISRISTISSPASQYFDFDDRTKTVASRYDDRSLRAQKILDEAPESVRYAYFTDDTAYPNFVVLVVAIRGVGTCELSIPREQYDGFKVLEIIEAVG